MGTVGDRWGQRGANINPNVSIFSQEFSDVSSAKTWTWGTFPTHKLLLGHLVNYRSRMSPSPGHGDFWLFAFLEVLGKTLQRCRDCRLVTKTFTDTLEIFYITGSLWISTLIKSICVIFERFSVSPIVPICPHCVPIRPHRGVAAKVESWKISFERRRDQSTAGSRYESRS